MDPPHISRIDAAEIAMQKTMPLRTVQIVRTAPGTLHWRSM